MLGLGNYLPDPFFWGRIYILLNIMVIYHLPKLGWYSKYLTSMVKGDKGSRHLTAFSGPTSGCFLGGWRLITDTPETYVEKP